MVTGLDPSSGPELREMVRRIKSEAATLCEQWDNFDIETIYHYTSVETAEKILRRRVLWASDVLSMTDTTEFKHAVGLVNEVLMSRWNVLPVAFAEYFRPSMLLLAGQTWDAFAT
jgi:hypothetical protein